MVHCSMEVSCSNSWFTVQDNGTGENAARDTFRIKIWRQADATVICDNQMGAGDEDYAGTAIGGGNVIIHASSS